MLSAVVLTKNEKKYIESCINSLLWCDEIIVIDDYSQDKTIDEVYKSCKVHKVCLHKQILFRKTKVFKRHLNNDFSSQRNFGLEKAQGDWVLFVDADERVTEELAGEIKSTLCHAEFSSASKDNQILSSKSLNEIQQQVQDDIKGIVGFYIKRQDYFLGKWLKYGEVGNINLLRLAKKTAGKWSKTVHEEWKIKGKIGKLDNPLLHYPHQTAGEFLQEINFYSTIRAQELFNQGKKTNLWQILAYPIGKFLQNYLVRLGFLDGIQGLILAIIMSFHSFLVRAKLYLLYHKHQVST